MSGSRSSTASPSPHRPPSPLRSLVYVAVSFLIVAGLVEGIARIVSLLGILEPAPTETLRTAWAEGGWAVDPLVGWTLVPDSVSDRGGAISHANSYGFRDREFRAEKPAGTLRVLSLGDSTALGFGVAQHLTYAERLEVTLTERLGRPVEVINAGIPGFASLQVLLLLKHRGLAFDPDIVIVETNFNDRRAVPPGATPDSAEQFRNLYRRLRLREILDHSMLTRLMRARLRSLMGRNALIETGDFDFREIRVDATPRISLADYEANIREIIRLSLDRGAEVILIGLPDDPARVGKLRAARQALAEQEWSKCESLLGEVEQDEVYALINQQLLNRVYRETNRESLVRERLPVRIAWTSTDGYLPVSLGDDYIDVLSRIGRDTDTPVIVPASEDEDLYLDYIHLNQADHRRLGG